jgi:AraC family L-rhamnose operon transcriptional activator RhaR
VAWTDRLDAVVPRLDLPGGTAGVYQWAQWSGVVENPPHRHTYFEVCRVDAGRGRFVVGGRDHDVEPGDLLFARPGVRHRILSPDPPGIGLSWVSFDLRPSPEATDEDDALVRAFLATDRAVARDRDTQVGSVWRALHACAAGPPRPGQRTQLVALGQALLVALVRAGGPDLPGTAAPVDVSARVVRQVTRYVHDNVDRPVRVDELARHVHLSHRQLTRLCAEHLGTSPAAYASAVRLDRAAALLVRTAQPIKQIAAATGFADVVQFTRAFTRRHGRPPGRFRADGDLSPVLTAAGPDAGPDAGMAGNVNPVAAAHKDADLVTEQAWP